MNKKLIWKFNIMDLLIIGLILLGVAALIYRGVLGGNGDERSYELTYVCSDAPVELLYDIHRGEVCVDGDLGTQLGMVSDVNAEEQDQGSGRGRAVIKAAADGVKTEHGIMIDDAAYLRGKELSLIVGDAVFSVYISDINEK